MHENETIVHTAESDSRWLVKTLQYELRLLQREHRHLAMKRRQRPLTTWERERMRSLRQESQTVLLKLGAFNYAAALQ